jgi:hypothetical protein
MRVYVGMWSVVVVPMVVFAMPLGLALVESRWVGVPAAEAAPETTAVSPGSLGAMRSALASAPEQPAAPVQPATPGQPAPVGSGFGAGCPVQARPRTA